MSTNFTLSIDCDTPAFKADMRRELVFLLRNVAIRVEDGVDCTTPLGVLDHNGVRVGQFLLTLTPDSRERVP